MKTFEIQIKGAAELTRRLKNYPKISGPIIQRTMQAVPAVLAKHTLKHNPVPYAKGGLLMSFRHRIGKNSAAWFPTAHYARMVEEGTRPHLITPKTARALRWGSGTSGRYVTSASGRRRYQSGQTSYSFAKYVKHPGTKAQPFMQPILNNSRQDLVALFAQANGRIVRELAGQ